MRAALECGLEVGGWCPPDGRSEAGVIPTEFRLLPTPEERSCRAPAVPRSLRTEWNVRDSDATLVVTPDPRRVDDPGSAFALATAERLGRPVLVVAPSPVEVSERVVEWLFAHRVAVLSVGGPSERTVPGIGARAHALVSAVCRATRSA